MSKHIKTKKGLEELLKRYEQHNAPEIWIIVIKKCIEQNISMDEVDYKLSSRNLKKLWKGLN